MDSPEILDYYAEGREEQRLTASVGRLEWMRTWEILERHLPPPRALSSASAAPLVAADVGDARWLPVPDAATDVVLLLGPLYHLIERADRVAALREARRVSCPAGCWCLPVSLGLRRPATVFSGGLRDPEFAAIVDRDLTDGIHRNPTSRPEWFTTAYLHHPDEIQTRNR